MLVVTSRALERLVPATLIVTIVGALFSQTRHYGLLGADSYPIIISSRIGSIADVLGNLTERLMDGRYAGEFYRPLLNFSFALDHAVWGLNAFGYQLTNALLLVTCAGALWSLLRRLLGPGALVGRVTGLLVFLLSPLQWEVLPVPPRRSELLCLAFMAIAISLQLKPGAIRARWPSIWSAVATSLAIASKETAFILPALIAIAVLVYSDRGTPWDRIEHSVVATIPHLAVVATMIGARFIVIGGIGGHAPEFSPQVRGLFGAWSEFGQRLMLPQVAMHSVIGHGLLTLLATTILLSLILLGTHASIQTRRDSARGVKTALLAGVWFFAFSGMLAVMLSDAWYALIPLAGWAMLAGGLIETFLFLAEDDDGKARGVTMVSLALLATMIVWQASYSPLFRRYDAWTRATSVGQTYLEQAQTQIENAEPGTVVEGKPLPYSVNTTQGHKLGGVIILSDYSIQAWIDLTLPNRNIRVFYGRGTVPAPAPNEIVFRIPGHFYVN